MLVKENKKILARTMEVVTHDKEASDIQVNEIFEHWNSKGIIVHRELTHDLIKVSKRRLAKTSKENIFLAISRYDEVLKSNYYFNYKWKLIEFLSLMLGHVEKFLDNGTHWVNYCQWANNSKQIPCKTLKEDQPQMPTQTQTSTIEININDIYAKCLNYLKMMDYVDYLKTEHWIHFKNEALKWAGLQCQLCGNDDALLHVHHKKYNNRGRETFSDVIVLCDKCHEKFHDKLTT